MASEDQHGAGRKPRSYYVDYSKRGSAFKDRRRAPTGAYHSNNSRYKEAPDITFGHRGFLITSIDEVKSYLEMRNILEEYFELFYNQPATSADHQQASATVEDEVEAELKQLRKMRPFKQVKTHCRNSLFINITSDFAHVDPVPIVEKFFDDMAEKRQLRSSNTFKVLPILDTFRSNTACAKESVTNIINTRFKELTEPRRYFIEFQSRGNYKLNPEDKQRMIEGIAETVAELRPQWSVSREQADFMIVLVALKSVCCISFLTDYFKRCKYNVVEFCKDFVPSAEQQEGQSGGVEEEPSEEPREKGVNTS